MPFKGAHGLLGRALPLVGTAGMQPDLEKWCPERPPGTMPRSSLDAEVL